MTSKKRFILPLDQNKLVLPQALIPKDTKAFMCELCEDGRIVLAPFFVSCEESQPMPENPKPPEGQSHMSNVINFNESRMRLKKQSGKDKKKAKRVEHQASETEGAEGSHSEGGFVKLCHFASRLEAEMLGEILKQAEIPYLIQSEDTGIFGPGAAPAPGGARIAVREADLEYAKITLSGLI